MWHCRVRGRTCHALLRDRLFLRVLRLTRNLKNWLTMTLQELLVARCHGTVLPFIALAGRACTGLEWCVLHAYVWAGSGLLGCLAANLHLVSCFPCHAALCFSPRLQRKV